MLLGVARGQLLVEGLATDPGNPVLKELANRLHRHQIGAIKMIPGVTKHEVADMLRLLGGDARHSTVGSRLEEFDGRWDHIRLLPPAYDRIELSSDGQARTGEQHNLGEGTAARLWLGLAAAALAREGAPELHTDPRAIAEALNQQMGEPERAKKVVSYLLGLSRELKLSHGAEAAVLKERLANLLNHIKPDTLKDLATLGADLAQRRKLVVDAAMVLPAGAVLTLLRAVSDSGSNQAIPHAMVRLLSKLAFQADKGAQSVREEADLALREGVRQLVERWTLTDPNPLPYSRVLERLSRHPAGSTGVNVEEFPAEAIRLIKISLETDTVGETVWAALEAMVAEGLATDVVTLVEDPNVAEDIAELYWTKLATPSNMRIMLSNEPRDTPVVEMLLERMGMTAAEPMLESLEVADNRTIRRRLLTRLGKLGPAIGPMLTERLPGAPWYVQRNLLALLGSLPEIPADFPLAEYAGNEDARVRREALKLMLRIPAYHDEAIVTAVGDDDDVNVRLGLTAALDGGCPAAAVSRVRILLNDPRLALELRVLAIRVLGTVKTPVTRDWLVGQALTTGGWFRRKKLVPKTPELVAVISCLAQGFRQDANAQLVLRLAWESSDAEIRSAAAGGETA